MPGPEAEAPRIGEGRDGLQDAIEVQQRLAHAHEDDVRQAPAAFREAAGGAADLVDDLGRLEVPPEAELAGRTERAADRAAGLARDAERVAFALAGARGVVHQDGLDQRAVRQPVEALLGQSAIADGELRIGERIDPERLAEAVTQPARQCPELVRDRCMQPPDAVLDLPHPVAGLTAGLHPGFERGRLDAG